LPSLKQVVAALIFQDDRLLVCQRNPAPDHAVEMGISWRQDRTGEQPRDALRRELNEELGIDATIGDEVACMRHDYTTVRGGIAFLRGTRVQGRN
jgi:8-oxo-dGTP pyrophosphatase MutT (NUDIX family)